MGLTTSATRAGGAWFASCGTNEALAEQYQKMARDLEVLIASGDIPGDLGI
jgi:hypothetical protein